MKLFVFLIIIIIIIVILFLLINFTRNSQSNHDVDSRETEKGKNFLLAVCRSLNDNKNIEDFIPYYLNQGVDQIYLLEGESSQKYDLSKYGDRVIIRSDRAAKKLYNRQFDLQKIHKELEHECEWLILLDSDDFIHTRKHSKKTIRKELETTFKDADCVLVPRVMFGSSGNIDEVNPLKQCITRWNHDKKHTHPYGFEEYGCKYDKVEVKCIFRPHKFGLIGDHNPIHPLDKAKIVESVNNNPCELLGTYSNLREKDIKEGYLLCNHYGTSSLNYVKRKCVSYSLPESYPNSSNKCVKYVMSNDHNEIKDTYLRDREIIKNSNS